MTTSDTTSRPEPDTNASARLARLLEAQQQVLAQVARNAPLEESLRSIALFAESWIAGMKGSILVYDAATGRLRRGGYGRLPPTFADVVDGLVPGPKMGSCGTCAYLRKRVVSRDVLEDPLWEGFEGLANAYGIRSAWSSPLLASSDGSLLGVFGMYHEEVRTMESADEWLVDHFACLASLAIERHRDQVLQRHQATHDALTGLGNRRRLAELSAEWVPAARRGESPLCVVFLDVDEFKATNDSLGHRAGDQLLQGLAGAMQTTFGTDAQAIRLGGDEFVLLARLDPEPCLARLETLRQATVCLVSPDGRATPARFSAGLVSVAATAGEAEIDALIQQADNLAMEAKAAGGDRVWCADTTRTTRWVGRQQVARNLAKALESEDPINPHLQPIVHLRDGSLHGFELLFRAHHPALVHVPVGDVIAVAEQSGLIHDIGNRMLEAAFALLARGGRSLAGKSLHVNVSVRQLSRREFPELVRRLVSRHPGLAPQLFLEITESEWLDPSGPAAEVLRDLKSLGVGLALDDFGTGHASLCYLQSLPFDTVKIDRSFVHQIDTNGRKQALCAALHAMASGVGMLAVAEGVERQEEANRLAAIGITCAQGFLWSRPLPADEALRLASRGWSSPASGE